MHSKNLPPYYKIFNGLSKSKAANILEAFGLAAAIVASHQSGLCGTMLTEFVSEFINDFLPENYRGVQPGPKRQFRVSIFASHTLRQFPLNTQD